MDLNNVDTRKSKNFQDRTDKRRQILWDLLFPWNPEAMNMLERDPSVYHDFSPKEQDAIKKGQDPLDTIRNRMRDAFLYKFIHGPDSLRGKHPKFKRKTISTAYDNY